MDSFPRVLSREDVAQAREAEKDRRKSDVLRVGKFQHRRMVALPPYSPPQSQKDSRISSTEDFELPESSAPIFTMTEIQQPSPTVPTSPTKAQPSASAQYSESGPDDSAWANFPHVYRGEYRNQDDALFHVTSRRIRPNSGMRKTASYDGVRNKKYAAIVDMLINEAATCSLLKVSLEPSIGNGMSQHYPHLALLLIFSLFFSSFSCGPRYACELYT